jgi:hypothetical protein
MRGAVHHLDLTVKVRSASCVFHNAGLGFMGNRRVREVAEALGNRHHQQQEDGEVESVECPPEPGGDPGQPLIRPTRLPRGPAAAHGDVGSVGDTLPRPASPVYLSGFRYNTAMASISIRNSGAARAVTATSVCAGIFFPKNSSRIGA